MRKNNLTCVLLAGTAAVTLISGILYTNGRNMQQKLADKVLRFHVLANSDSEVDQQLKYQVRDAVGCYLQKELGTADSREESEQIITGQLEQIQEVAEETVKEHGYSYSVRAELEETAFPVKSYGSFTFPSGTYEALRVVIGEGKGHNWWCVLYPNLCFEGSLYEISEEKDAGILREVLSEEELQAVLKSGNYKIQCKYFTFLNPYLEKLTE